MKTHVLTAAPADPKSMPGSETVVRVALEALLTRAEKHIAEAERYIVRQRKTIAALESGGSDTRSSRLLLARLEEAQSRRILRRDLILTELSYASLPEGERLVAYAIDGASG